ncbi:MAG: hypothetical protein V3R78_00815, partial [Thermodesulfobacteriota bacterium]
MTVDFIKKCELLRLSKLLQMPPYVVPIQDINIDTQVGVFYTYPIKKRLLSKSVEYVCGLNPDFAVDVVSRRRKPQRNEQLERFCDEGIFINMLRSKIVKQALQQGFSSRS